MLSFMASEYFQRSPMLLYPLVALALFMLVFLIVTVRAVLFSRTPEYEAIARLPLESTPNGAGVTRSQKESGHE